MKLNPVSSNGSNLIFRLFAFFPVLLLTLPAFAETFALPNCPFPEVLQDQKSLLVDCNQPDPAAASQPTKDPSQLAAVAPVAGNKGDETPATPSQTTTTPNPTSPTQPATAPPPPAPPAAPVSINKIDFYGNTVFNQTELDALVNSGKGKPATRQELCRISGEVAKAYKDRGYILAQAFPLIDRATESLVNKDGNVRFLAIEGCLEKIEIVGTKKLKPDYINSRIVAGAATPFNANKINDLLALIQTDPKIGKLEVLGITPGVSFGSSSLGLKVTEANFLAGFLGSDSYVAPAFGSTRLIGGLTYRNFTNNGDDLNATYFRSTTNELDGFDLSYQLPLNSMNGQLLFRYAPTNVKLNLQPNNEKFTSASSTAEVTYRQPLVRSSKNEFALSLGVSLQDEKTLINGAPTNTTDAASQGKTQIPIGRFTQEYTSTDDGGNWSLRSQFNLGFGNVAANTNPKPLLDGKFFTWQSQIQRVQRFGQDNYAIFVAEAQLSPDRLLPNQQLTIGGGQSIKGYRQNVRSGDNGVRLSIEDRHVVGRNGAGQATLQLVASADAAQIWNNNGSPTIDKGLLASVGAGVIWEPIPRLTTRLDYALPLRNIADRGSSFEDSGVSFSIGYGF